MKVRTYIRISSYISTAGFKTRRFSHEGASLRRAGCRRRRPDHGGISCGKGLPRSPVRPQSYPDPAASNTQDHPRYLKMDLSGNTGANYRLPAAGAGRCRHYPGGHHHRCPRCHRPSVRAISAGRTNHPAQPRARRRRAGGPAYSSGGACLSRPRDHC